MFAIFATVPGSARARRTASLRRTWNSLRVGGGGPVSLDGGPAARSAPLSRASFFQSHNHAHRLPHRVFASPSASETARIAEGSDAGDGGNARGSREARRASGGLGHRTARRVQGAQHPCRVPRRDRCRRSRRRGRAHLHHAVACRRPHDLVDAALGARRGLPHRGLPEARRVRGCRASAGCDRARRRAEHPRLPRGWLDRRR